MNAFVAAPLQANAVIDSGEHLGRQWTAIWFHGSGFQVLGFRVEIVHGFAWTSCSYDFGGPYGAYRKDLGEKISIARQ